jgi:Raf kinase inhibitor-like YbhB/YbcL family protein
MLHLEQKARRGEAESPRHLVSGHKGDVPLTPLYGAHVGLVQALWYLFVMAIEVSSPAFEPGGAIPQKYTGEGRDVSPPLIWEGLPDETKEIALICDDPDAPTPNPWVHWVVYKIPADVMGFREGSTQGEVLEGKNDFGTLGYGGPMPPRGHGVHHYYFKVYALDVELEVAAGLTKEQLLEAIKGHVLDEGELVGTYERK